MKIQNLNTNFKNFTTVEISSLFWDINFSKLDLQKDHFFIIKRILEYGDSKSVKWMFENYSDKKIKSVLYETRDISKKSFSYWELYFNKKEKQNV